MFETLQIFFRHSVYDPLASPDEDQTHWTGHCNGSWFSDTQFVN